MMIKKALNLTFKNIVSPSTRSKSDLNETTRHTEVFFEKKMKYRPHKLYQMVDWIAVVVFIPPL